MGINASELVSELQKRKRVTSRIQRNIKKNLKIKRDSINEVFESNKILDRIKKDAPNVYPEELRDSILKYIETDKAKNRKKFIYFEKTFGKKLHDELEKKGYSLGGRLPDLKVNYYGLKINIQENKCKIYYGWDEEYLGIEKLDAKKITKFITSFDSNLEKNKFDKSILLKSYNKVKSRQKQSFGNRVPIVDLLLQVAIDKQNTRFINDPTESNYKTYGRVNFSHDLYKLKRDKELKIRLFTANRAQVRKKSDYLWVPISQTSGSVYSYLEIMEEI